LWLLNFDDASGAPAISHADGVVDEHIALPHRHLGLAAGIAQHLSAREKDEGRYEREKEKLGDEEKEEDANEKHKDKTEWSHGIEFWFL
jgi:hypothetical protein